MLASGFTPLPNALARRAAFPGNIRSADAIVVLGSSVRPDGTLDDASHRRTINGVVLFRRGLAPLLALSGVTLGPGLSEPAARAALARNLGVAAETLVVVGGIRTTREEIQALRPVLHMRGVRRVLLVTDLFHIKRAHQLFLHAGFEVISAPSDDISAHVTAPSERWKLTRRILEEWIALGYYRMAGYL
jgi:uncharacterized SAM-binding protein YcdF (DUF218 family)